MQNIKQKITPKQFLKKRLSIGKTVSESFLKVGNFPGYTAIVKGKTPYGQGNVRVVVLFAGKKAFIFLASTKQASKFAYIDSQVLKSIKSFSTLSRKDKAAAKELKVVIKRVSRTNRKINNIAKMSPITHHAEDQLRLLNDFYPNGEPKLGDLFKVIR